MNNLKYRIVDSKEDYLIMLNIVNEVWPLCYKEILSQEQIEYMIHWMYNIDKVKEETKNDSPFFIVSNENDEDIAIVSYDTVPKEDGKVMLHKLYMKKEFWGKSLGQEILTHVTNEAIKAGAKYINIQVNRFNTRAQKAYARNGFTIYKTLCTDIGNGFVMDDYFMKKDL